MQRRWQSTCHQPTVSHQCEQAEVHTLCRKSSVTKSKSSVEENPNQKISTFFFVVERDIINLNIRWRRERERQTRKGRGCASLLSTLHWNGTACTCAYWLTWPNPFVPFGAQAEESGTFSNDTPRFNVSNTSLPSLPIEYTVQLSEANIRYLPTPRGARPPVSWNWPLFGLVESMTSSTIGARAHLSA